MDRWIKVALWCIPTFIVGYGVAILTGVVAMCSSDNPVAIAGLIASLLSIPVFLISLPIGLIRNARKRKSYA